MTNRICEFPECTKSYMANGLCSSHYMQAYRGKTLTPLGSTRTYQRMDVDKFWARVERGNGCWEWRGVINGVGYGQLKWDSSLRLAHRVAWELTNGAIAAGASLDHLCFNPACVRPEHLRETTHKQNLEHRKGAQSNSKSGVRGVYPSRGRWRAQLTHNGKHVHLGAFDTIEEAERAVIAGRAKYFTHSDEKS